MITLDDSVATGGGLKISHFGDGGQRSDSKRLYTYNP